METNPKMAQMLELADKEFKGGATTMLNEGREKFRWNEWRNRK